MSEQELITRRSFLKGLVAGVATVAIATKMAPKLAMEEAYYAHERFSVGFTDARALYGSVGERYAQALAKSMQQTKERIAADVINRAFTQPSYTSETYGLQEVLYDDGELLHEMYEDQAEGFIHNVYPNGTNHLKAEHLADYLEALSEAA